MASHSNDITPADRVSAQAVMQAREMARVSLAGYQLVSPRVFWFLVVAVSVALVSNAAVWIYVLR